MLIDLIKVVKGAESSGKPMLRQVFNLPSYLQPPTLPAHTHPGLAALQGATFLEGMTPTFFPPPKSPSNSLRTTAASKKQSIKVLLPIQGLMELK